MEKGLKNSFVVCQEVVELVKRLGGRKEGGKEGEKEKGKEKGKEGGKEKGKEGGEGEEGGYGVGVISNHGREWFDEIFVRFGIWEVFPDKEVIWIFVIFVFGFFY